MKILAVIETDLVEKGPHQTHHLFERLSMNGHEVRIIDYEINWRRRKRRSLISEKVVIKNFHKAIDMSKVILIRPKIVYIPLVDYASEVFYYGREIFEQIKLFKPDVIVGFSILNTYIAMKFAKRYNIPFVYYLIDAQHTQIPETLLKPLGKFIESMIVQNADRILVINDELAKYAVRLGGSPEKIYVLRAGIDYGRFNPNIDGKKIRVKHGIQEDEVVLFFMGWLYTFSGLKEVANSLINHYGKTKIRLMILGKGDLYDELVKMKSQLGNRLILIDWQPYYKVPEYIAAADMCLLPAYNNEVMRHIVPIKMYEYMACGKPVIATRLPGIMKEFGEGNGVIYVERPEEVLNKALEISKDEQKLKELGMKAAEYVRKYSWEAITDQFEELLEDLVNNRTSCKIDRSGLK
jgi:glycosyltransferase involved in cell wall biosynthesis